MSRVTVNLLKRAEQDMEAIYHYIAEEFQSPQAAMIQFEVIAEAIQTLEVFPERCAVVEELLRFNIVVRRLLVKTILYFIVWIRIPLPY